MARPEVNTYQVPFTGKLINSVDGLLIGKNYKSLINLRYTDTNIRAVLGMTKINSTPITNTGITNGYHYIKPGESHVIVQGKYATDSSLYESTDSVPSTGTFSELHIEAASSDIAYFSSSPHGELIACNSLESHIWPGDTAQCAGFILTNVTSTFYYEYTDEVSNEFKDAENIAVFGNGLGASIDSSTMLLLHLDNDVTDSSPNTPHTVSNVGVTFDAGDYKFATHSAVFNGSTRYLAVPDDADFNFNGGTWTIDCWINPTSLAANGCIYEQASSAQSKFWIQVHTDGSLSINLNVGGGAHVIARTAASVISTGSWQHVEFSENNNSWYIFVGGVLKKAATSALRCPNYTGSVTIGLMTTTTLAGPSFGPYYYNGKMDEFRVSNICRHTSNFTPPVAEYSSSTSSDGIIYIGSLLPISSFYLNILTPNTQTSTMTAYYWDGSAWVAVSSQSDGTSSGGVTLAQSGSVSFDDTSDVSKINSINNLLIYWYKIAITSVDSGTSIYNSYVVSQMQEIVDIWDGAPRTCFNFQIYSGTAYSDNTLNVAEIDYSSANDVTYADASAIATNGWLIAGFNERMTGINIIMAGGNINTNAATVAVSYWDGTDWVAASGVSDGTFDGANTFSRSGTITWSSPSKSMEFKTKIAKEELRYYYKISFSATLSATVFIDNLTGIPAQEKLSAYKFPAHGLGRLWLCNDTYGNANEAIYSAFGTTQVFNGEDSDRLLFGDSQGLTAAATLYSQFGSSLYDVMVFTKVNETWVLVNDGQSLNRFRVSDSIGCIAPRTMQSTHISGELAPGINRNIAIWQGAQGVYLFDGRTPLPIHNDIKQYFDRTDSSSINLTYITNSVGFFSEDGTEYHWLFASGTSTTLNKELVFDINKQRWFEIDRGTKYLQAGFQVKDSNGVSYTYGALNTGYVERLENGTDFDGDTINYTVHFGDMILADELTETEIRKIKIFAKNKTNGNDITVTHYGDTATTGTSYTLSQYKTGEDQVSGSAIAYGVNIDDQDQSFKHYTTHSLKITTSNTSETIGFEPLHMALGFKLTRRD